MLKLPDIPSVPLERLTLVDCRRKRTPDCWDEIAVRALDLQCPVSPKTDVRTAEQALAAKSGSLDVRDCPNPGAEWPEAAVRSASCSILETHKPPFRIVRPAPQLRTPVQLSDLRFLTCVDFIRRCAQPNDAVSKIRRDAGVRTRACPAAR
jgi:hypothetical protein